MKMTKVISALVILATFSSLAQARFYLGAEGGYTYNTVDITDDDGDIINAYIGNGYLINLDLGNEYREDNESVFASRWIGQIGYGEGNLFAKSDRNTKYFSRILNISIGGDLFFNALQFGKKKNFGFFLGVEFGTRILLSNATYMYRGKMSYVGDLGLLFGPRLGLSLALGKHNRIELIGKMILKYSVDDVINGIFDKLNGEKASDTTNKTRMFAKDYADDSRENKANPSFAFDAMLSYKYIF
ncbi:outer membrane beta-barrel protein [Helicobacter sp. 11S02596-1]|uniref:outer membrane beta-barrel protein n=1 Tax=Helicobacter sp. 11S02596-1 TaxID=1476194 RepID=UPI000BA7C1BE|nr:outer membrane beta-barrel protein [Helicobacter sp. 11S02596-1]PAF42087.1 hypothetical protein BJI48_07180 [Helicobacter sp. 11S02596-1]